MIEQDRQDMREDDEGFTLIELLVVVLILGILMAIAIPTILGLTGDAKTNAAEANLTTAAQDEAIYFARNGTYGANADVNVPAMKLIETGINWVIGLPDATSAGTKTVGVLVLSSSTTVMDLVTLASDGKYYGIDLSSGALTYNISTSTSTTYPPTTGHPFGSSWNNASHY